MGSARRTTIAVRTVFRCVASRNRERTARPRGAARHSKTGFDSDKRNARGYSWSSSVPSGSGSARYLGFQLRLSRPTGQQNALWARCVASRKRGAAGHANRAIRVRKTLIEPIPALECRAAPVPPGCRGYDHGKVRGIGSNGFNWLSAIPQENATARNLHFNTEGGQSESSN